MNNSNAGHTDSGHEAGTQVDSETDNDIRPIREHPAPLSSVKILVIIVLSLAIGGFVGCCSCAGVLMYNGQWGDIHEPVGKPLIGLCIPGAIFAFIFLWHRERKK